MKLLKKLLFLIVTSLFVVGFCFFNNFVEAKEMTQEEISESVRISKADRMNIIQSIPQILTNQWVDSVVEASTPRDQAIVLILRGAVRSKIRDYLLTEAPKELSVEVIKGLYKLVTMSVTKDLSTMIKEIEKMTVKETVKYLGQWLIENKTKIGAGDIDFSYKDKDGEKQKHRIQYIIIFKPDDTKGGRAIINIYCNSYLKVPTSRGSWGGLWGTQLVDEIDEEIHPFILTIEGDMRRKQVGWWKSQFMHEYSWEEEPDVRISFPDEVPEFDFKPKGFFEKIGDSIKGFFRKVGDFFSPAAVVEAPDIETEEGPGILEEIKGLLEKIIEQLKLIGDRFSQSQKQEIEQKIKETEQEEDPEELAKKLTEIEARLNAIFKQLNQQKDGAEEEKEEQEQDKEENLGINLVINEVCAGLDNSVNEFVELYNPTDSAVNLSEMLNLKLVSSSDKQTNKTIEWLETDIPSKGYFLMLAGELAVDGQILVPDAKFSSQLTSVSGVIIEDKEGNVLDSVSWGKPDQTPPQSAVETQGKILEKGLLTGQSLYRTNFIDTDDNSVDFKVSEFPNPVNSKGESLILEKKDTDQGQEEQNTDHDEQSNTGGGGPAQPSVTYCSQDDLAEPSYFPVVFQEIAWMGTEDSSSDEWFKLKNISTSSVNLHNWQILDKDEQIKIKLENYALEPGEYYFLERTDDNSLPGQKANAIYTGGLNNFDETLRLFNPNCDLIDEVIASSTWPAGDNDTKETMKRADDLTWYSTSTQEDNGQEDNGQEESGQNDDLLVTEVRAGGNYEFIEIYNSNNEQIELSDYWLSYFSKDRNWNEPFLSKQFPTSTIQAKDYYVIGLGDYSSSDWQAFAVHLSDTDGAVGLFKDNPRNSSTTQEAEDSKIDVLGWGDPIVKEIQAAAAAQQEKSLSRKIEPDANGFLSYIDTDNNSNDFSSQTSTPGQLNLHDYQDLNNNAIVDSQEATTTISSTTTLPAGEYVFNNLELVGNGCLNLLSDINLSGFKGVKIKARNLKINENARIKADFNGYEDHLDIPRDYSNPETLGSAGLDIPANSCCLKRSGGSGGGAMILEVSEILENNGTISSNGQNGLDKGSYGCAATDGGDGGSIKIITAELKGSGAIMADGGNAFVTGVPGAGGQVAIYYAQEEFSGEITAFGGLNNNKRTETGTVYFSNTQDKLVIKNGKYFLNSLTGLDFIEFHNLDLELSTSSSIQAVDILINQSIFQGKPKQVFSISGNSLVLTDSAIKSNLNIQVQEINLGVNSQLSADTLGYQTDEGPGCGTVDHSGASYGGIGGANSTSSVYGASSTPQDFGSGAKSVPANSCCGSRRGGSGGGKIFIEAVSLVVSGIISANGEDGLPKGSYGCAATGGGSGGSIYIVSSITGNGLIESNGGNASSVGRAGGGGRIAVYGNRTGFSGIIQSLGGTHVKLGYCGTNGTVYLNP